MATPPVHYANALLNAVAQTALCSPESSAFAAAHTKTVTYGELWDMAQRIAAGLKAHIEGRGPVLVLGHKEASTVAAFLGCLLSGHAFVPIDVELPAERVAQIASQIPHAVLLATCDVPENLATTLSACTQLHVDALQQTDSPIPEPACCVAGEETQYIIFTSGSTGRPKGIEVTAANVAHFMEWMYTFPVVSTGGCVFLDQAHYSFDLSEYELVGALTTGGCLYALPSALEHDFASLFKSLAESQVQVWVSTPSFADICLVDKSFNAQLMPSVQLFLFCGETLHHVTAEKLHERFPDARIANTYGPTESTVAITYGEIGERELRDPAPLPVGKPRPGTELSIVDHDTGKELPCGSTGEIIIRGTTVARGYYRNEKKTRAAFFETTLSDGTPCRGYRTGDLGHLDASGVLHCEGRLDSLVKVNGFRIELDEVEGALTALAGVREAAVVPVVHGNRVTSLGAFIVLETRDSADNAFDIVRGFKAALAKTLPAYMVPRQMQLVDELPLTANEKIDRKRLAQQLARPARHERGAHV